MSEVLATFRELKGIGPATEARLHEAGVLSWTALADVLAVLNQVQGRGSGSATVRELAGLAAARAAEVGDGDVPRLPTGHQVVPAQEPPAADRLVVLDAGLVIGGHVQDIELQIGETRSVGTDFSYRATLAGHPLGAPGWAELARQDGQAHPPDQLPLRFGHIELPPGVHRLQVQLVIQAPVSLRAAPKLVLAS